jgi:rubrerythrin
MRTLGKTSKKSKVQRKISYHKQILLKQLRISEENTEFNDPSMNEILHKQGASRGLFIVNESVYKFFVRANSILQASLKPEYIHLHISQLQGQCRNLLLSNEELLEVWLNLFQSVPTDDREEEIFTSLLLDLFAEVMDYFIKLALIDAIKEFKDQIPRKKKQALRSKVTALGERGGQRTGPIKKSRKDTHGQLSVSPSTSQSDEVYICGICGEECEDQPIDDAYQSIACDKCNKWLHYSCVDIKGDEAFLFKQKSKWQCPSCRPTYKGKGKGRGKGKKS